MIHILRLAWLFITVILVLLIVVPWLVDVLWKAEQYDKILAARKRNEPLDSMLTEEDGL